jgi:two-component system sensor histidine kinase UhpB
MREALSEELLRYMQIRLYDIGPAVGEPEHQPGGAKRLLFDTAQLGKTAGGQRPLENESLAFVYAVPVEVASRVWEFQYGADKAAVIGHTDRMLPRLVLAGGLVVTLLVFGVFYSLASSRSRAERIANDMTKHLRESEASLVEAHALLSDAQKLAGVGCCQYSLTDGRLIWSEELYRIHGVDPASFRPSYESVAQLVHPEDRPAWEESIATALRNRETFTIEFRIVRPDGTVRHLRSLGEVLTDGTSGPARMLWSVLDITEHKALEHTLRESADQLTALSRRLVDVQEAERRKLSRELHDRVGQNLTALSINLDILRISLDEALHAEQRGRIDDSARLLERTADSIENVMSELRPPMLDDYGLLPALQWYAADFSKRTAIDVHVSGTEERERLAPEIEITLFRVAQEALTNVAKHAEASLVEIVLDQVDEQCEMSITDNGVGIGPTREGGNGKRPRLGMVTMRERAQAIGGRFQVRTMPGGGTQIAISIP